jgi:hypothetical protein
MIHPAIKNKIYISSKINNLPVHVLVLHDDLDFSLDNNQHLQNLKIQIYFFETKISNSRS